MLGYCIKSPTTLDVAATQTTCQTHCISLSMIPIRQATAACAIKQRMANVLVYTLLVQLVSFIHSEHLRVSRAHMPTWESGVRLDGSRTSYAQFSPWSVCQNASLSFEFQTSHSTALIMYADDGQRFVEVRLVRGSLQLRYRLSTTTENDSLMTIGDDLHDGLWHAVRLWSHDGFRLVIAVDVAMIEAPRAGVDRFVQEKAGTVRLTTGTFVGGLPATVRRRPGGLAVPTVAFELRLVGSVRNFRLSRCSPLSSASSEIPAELLGGRGMTPADRPIDDRCRTDNPCLHGGICVNTAAGPLCECDRTDFDGIRCSIGLLCRFFTVIYLRYLSKHVFVSLITVITVASTMSMSRRSSLR